MLKTNFILADGAEQSFEAHAGWSVMETARKYNVPGIVAECGGSATCSTCHVYVESPWLEILGPKSEIETALVEMAPGCDETRSRLSCQIILRPELDGITVRVPTSQYES